jgi:hypothetical protein
VGRAGSKAAWPASLETVPVAVVYRGWWGRRLSFIFYFIFDIFFLILLTSGVFSTSANTCFL